MHEVHHDSVFFTGHVQGVGFRYTALQVAKEFEVAGYVRNLFDGRVQVEVEGEKREIDAFIAGVLDAMPGHVRDVERHPGRRAPQFRGFEIR